MSIEKSIGIKNKSVEEIRDWDSAISDAQERVKRLKHSIKVFQQHRDAGDKWPGIKKAGTVSETIPA